VKVRWTDKSRRHLRAIHDYIAADSPKYASRTLDRITRKGDGLKRFPLSGRVVPEYEMETIRQVLEGNYRIIYRVDVNAVVILAVIHAARRMPPLDAME
jgi:plasmid stabilization system protein ParE